MIFVALESKMIVEGIGLGALALDGTICGVVIDTTDLDLDSLPTNEYCWITVLNGTVVPVVLSSDLIEE